MASNLEKSKLIHFRHLPSNLTQHKHILCKGVVQEKRHHLSIWMLQFTKYIRHKGDQREKDGRKKKRRSGRQVVFVLHDVED